jgi:FkbM family methyltransferase
MEKRRMMMTRNLDLKKITEGILQALPETSSFHRRDHKLYNILNELVKHYFENTEGDILEVEPFTGMVWPHMDLGNLNSYCFFTLDEMILYAFYWINRRNYHIAFDIGANIGIDAIILSRFGYDVHAFEPDPALYKIFVENMKMNKCQINTYNKGVSDKREVVDFTRVKGNMTANHIAGERNFYGETENIKIETMTFGEIGFIPDLMKINIEGHEKKLVPSISIDEWRRMDAFIEIHSPEDGRVIFDYFNGSEINIFSQKTGWGKIESFDDMVKNNKEGYVFISKKGKMPWSS